MKEVTVKSKPKQNVMKEETKNLSKQLNRLNILWSAIEAYAVEKKMSALLLLNQTRTKKRSTGELKYNTILFHIWLQLYYILKLSSFKTFVKIYKKKFK